MCFNVSCWLLKPGGALAVCTSMWNLRFAMRIMVLNPAAKPVLSHMCPITRGYQGNDNEGNEMSMTLHQMMLECSLTGAMSCAGGVPNGLVCHESVDMQPNTNRCYGFNLLNLPLPFFNASQGTII